MKADWIGKRFGRLVVESVDTYKPYTKLNCRCDCGNTKSIMATNLRNGRSSSCHYCNKVHPLYKQLYLTWNCMLSRCYNPNARGYHNYGGRGIKVQFPNFRTFADHMGKRPTNKHSVDRIDNDGHYEAGNLRWATPKQQANNQRKRGQWKPAKPCNESYYWVKTGTRKHTLIPITTEKRIAA